MPTAALRRAIRGLARSQDALLTDYPGTRGSVTLRRLLLARLTDEGIAATGDGAGYRGLQDSAGDGASAPLHHQFSAA